MPSSPGTRHLLIPFAGRGTPNCRAALAALKLPNLARLLSRLQLDHEDAQDESTLSPPHERGLAAALGIGAADGRLPWAAWQARALDLQEAQPGAAWGLLTSCHGLVGIDDVALGDPGMLEIAAEESAALLDTMRPFFAEIGIALFPTAHSGRWLAQGQLFDGLATASIDRAVGHPISQWSPMTDAARPVRRLQNEVQMLLYTHPVNDARAERGMPAINLFWLSGTGDLPLAATPSAAMPEVDERLRAAALSDDGQAWAQAWESLDAQRLPALLADLDRGLPVQLSLCGDRAARRYAPRAKGGATAFVKRLLERAPTPADVLGAL